MPPRSKRSPQHRSNTSNADYNKGKAKRDERPGRPPTIPEEDDSTSAAQTPTSPPTLDFTNLTNQLILLTSNIHASVASVRTLRASLYHHTTTLRDQKAAPPNEYSYLCFPKADVQHIQTSLHDTAATLRELWRECNDGPDGGGTMSASRMLMLGFLGRNVEVEVGASVAAEQAEGMVLKRAREREKEKAVGDQGQSRGEESAARGYERALKRGKSRSKGGKIASEDGKPASTRGKTATK